MEWTDISGPARATMLDLGHFGPTVNASDRQVKGYMHDEDGGGKVYWDSETLRDMAYHLFEVADWLDKRAEMDDSF